MNGFGHQLRGVFWFDAYWIVFAVLLLLLAYLMWVRGLADESALATRHRPPPLRTPSEIARGHRLRVSVALGGFIIYNTNVLHIFRTRTENEKLTVRYEHDYRKYLNIPQPRITSVSYQADIYPEQPRHPLPRQVRLHQQDLAADRPSAGQRPGGRRSSTGSNSIVPPARRPRTVPVDLADLSLRSAARARRNRANSLSTSNMRTHGFQNERGSDRDRLQRQLSSAAIRFPSSATRKARNFPRTTRAASTNSSPSRACTISTTPPRAAITTSRTTPIGSPSTPPSAPARTRSPSRPANWSREWTEGGRRYFQYQTRGKVLNFSSVLSARYHVMRDRWNDVALEIYYQPGHEYNLAKMMKGMKKSLEYCTTNFSPYQNKTVRIIEFPRYAIFRAVLPGVDSVLREHRLHRARRSLERRGRRLSVLRHRSRSRASVVGAPGDRRECAGRHDDVGVAGAVHRPDGDEARVRSASTCGAF